MNQWQVIPGVTINVFKQDRQLVPEEDGYVGQLRSGFAVLELVVEPGKPMIGLQQQSNDKYSLVADWMVYPPNYEPKESLQRVPWWYRAQPAWYEEVGCKLADGTKVFRKKIVLEANEDNDAFVAYPQNVLTVAEYLREGGQFTDRVKIWKVALVTQQDEGHFVVSQLKYDTTAHRKGKKVLFPRFRKHKALNQILVESMPESIELTLIEVYRDEEGPALKFLQGNQGVVTSWYAPRNLGVIMTNHGKARVHAADVPGRPRRAYLVPGEVVEFKKLDKPFRGKKTQYHRPRKSKMFIQQAYEVTPLGMNVESAA